MPAITEQPSDTLISRAVRDQRCTGVPPRTCRPALLSVGKSKNLLLSLATYLLDVKSSVTNTFLVGASLMFGQYFPRYQQFVDLLVKQTLQKGIPSNIANEVKLTSLAGC